MRKAKTQELAAWLALVPGGLDHADNVAQAWVIEEYTTDCPGYGGPVGFILWSGSPAWACIFIRKYKTLNDWELAVNTVALLEGDQRGCFDQVVERIAAADGPDENLFQYLTGELVEETTLAELFDTGSVTTNILGRQYVLTINIKEAS